MRAEVTKTQLLTMQQDAILHANKACSRTGLMQLDHTGYSELIIMTNCQRCFSFKFKVLHLLEDLSLLKLIESFYSGFFNEPFFVANNCPPWDRTQSCSLVMKVWRALSHT